MKNAMPVRLAISLCVFMTSFTLIAWNTGVLWFLGPSFPIAIKVVYTSIPILIGLAFLVAWITSRYQRITTLSFAIITVTCGVIFFSEIPSNNREWQSDVANLASAEIAGKKLVIKNVRNFHYISERIISRFGRRDNTILSNWTASKYLQFIGWEMPFLIPF